MKSDFIKVKLIAVAAAVFLSNSLFAQSTVSFKNKTEITEAQIQYKTKGGHTIRYIDPASLKKGHNYLTLPSGDILYVEYGSGKVKSISLTSKAGLLKDKVIVTGSATQFQCGPIFCMCTGDADCNDMFTTNVCGPSAICINNVCFCAR